MVSGCVDLTPQANSGPPSQQAPLIAGQRRNVSGVQYRHRMTNTIGREAASGQGKTAEETESGDIDASLVPTWMTENKYLVLTAEILLLILLAVAGAPHGPVETFLLEAAAYGVQAVTWRWGYQRRRVAHWQCSTMMAYVDHEMAAVDLLGGTRFEDYVVKVLTAVGYGNAHRTGNDNLRKGVDIVAEVPGGGATAGVECKRQQDKVESEVVTKLVGAVNMYPYKGHVPILITNSFLTVVARVKARNDNVTVYERDGLRDLIAKARPAMEERGESAVDYLSDGISISSMPEPSPPRHVTVAARRTCTAVLCFAGVMATVLFVQVAAPRHVSSASARADAQPSGQYSPQAGKAPASARTASSVLAPAQVIKDFYAAISRHDWRQVWLLGGKNLGRGPYASYAGMITGYRGTVRDVLRQVNVSGDNVTGSFIAYQSSGATRLYLFDYVVRKGVIVSGYQE
jgi:hypothetical protein